MSVAGTKIRWCTVMVMAAMLLFIKVLFPWRNDVLGALNVPIVNKYSTPSAVMKFGTRVVYGTLFSTVTLIVTLTLEVRFDAYNLRSRELHSSLKCMGLHVISVESYL